MEFLWWDGVGGVCTVIFVSNPTTVEVVLRLSWGFDNFKVESVHLGKTLDSNL